MSGAGEAAGPAGRRLRAYTALPVRVVEEHQDVSGAGGVGEPLRRWGSPGKGSPSGTAQPAPGAPLIAASPRCPYMKFSTQVASVSLPMQPFGHLCKQLAAFAYSGISITFITLLF